METTRFIEYDFNFNSKEYYFCELCHHEDELEIVTGWLNCPNCGARITDFVEAWKEEEEEQDAPPYGFASPQGQV